MLMAPMVMVAESEGLKSEEELAKTKRNQSGKLTINYLLFAT